MKYIPFLVRRHRQLAEPYLKLFFIFKKSLFEGKKKKKISPIYQQRKKLWRLALVIGGVGKLRAGGTLACSAEVAMDDDVDTEAADMYLDGGFRLLVVVVVVVLIVRFEIRWDGRRRRSEGTGREMEQVTGDRSVAVDEEESRAEDKKVSPTFIWPL